MERLRAEHDDLRERLEAAEQDVERAEARADDRRRQLREANAKNDDVEECVTYVQDERSAERRRREAGILTRTKWWLVGQPSNDEE